MMTVNEIRLYEYVCPICGEKLVGGTIQGLNERQQRHWKNCPPKYGFSPSTGRFEA